MRPLFFLAATTTAPRAQPQDGDFGPLVLDYIEGMGGAMLRSTTLTLTPTSQNGERSRNVKVHQLVVVTETGQWHVLDGFLSSGHSSGVVRAEAMLPAAESVILILFLTEGNRWRGWQLKDTRGYANQEVSYFDQSGRRLRTPPCAPRECLADITDASRQVEATRSGFRVEIVGRSR